MPPASTYSSSNNKINQTKSGYFLGFEDPSSELQELWHRWKALDRWIELAIPPADCHPSDRFLLPCSNASGKACSPQQHLVALQEQRKLVQQTFNHRLSTLSIETTEWESSLVVRPSQIPGAGNGLYFKPKHSSINDNPSTNNNSSNDNSQQQQQRLLPSGSLVCYYTGHVHTHSSARELGDGSYLLWVRGNTLVDPGPLPRVTARYLNDPLNENLVNCAFVPTTAIATQPDESPHPDTIRTSVVTIREVHPGEELFVSYGDTYWNQQSISGNRWVPGTADTRTHGGSSNSNAQEAFSREEERRRTADRKDEEDSDDESFPFSPSFQSNLANPSIWE